MSTEKRIPSALPMQYRTAVIDAERKDGERLSGPDPGRFSFAVSSTEPVRRYFGDEVLLHDKANVRTQRLEDGMVPSLFNHNADQQLGAVDSHKLKDGKLTVSGPFSRSAFAQEKRQDYDDGILKAASVGYKVHKMTRIEDEDNPNAPDRCEVTDWEPFDASLVTVPADATVGVGRAASAEDFPVEVETVGRRSLGPPRTGLSLRGDLSAVPETSTVIQPKQEIRIMADTAVVPSAAELDIARRNEIMAVATDKDFRRYTSLDDAQRAIAENTSANAFKDAVTRKIVEANDVTKVGTAGDAIFAQLSAKEQKRYSVFRYVRSLVNDAKSGTFRASISDATMERELSDAIRKMIDVPNLNGPLVPLAALRALGTQTIASGSGQLGLTSEAALTQITTRPEVIEMLRHRPRCVQLGARTLGGLQGIIRLPRQDTAGNWQWVGEGGAVTPSDLTTDFISVQPHRGSSQASWTIEELASTAPDVEALARADMEKNRNLALDYTAMYGTGASNQPLGLLNTTGLPTVNPSGVAFTDLGLPLTYADIAQFEELIAAADADFGTMAWMVTPGVRKALKTTPMFASGLADPIWPRQPLRDALGIEDGPLGYRAAVTNQLSSTGAKIGSFPNASYTANALHTAVFGDWSQLLFADWGAVEFVIDPYTQAASGAIVVTQRSLHDIAVRHIAAFAASFAIAVS
jgi:HK97 family phage major capsid protein